MKWNDYPSYYKEFHRDALREIRPVGRGESKIFFADHPGGHIDIPETPDILLVLGTHIPGHASVDFGDKKVDMSNSSGREFVICPPNTSCKVAVQRQHQTITLAVPYQLMVEAVNTDSSLPIDGDFGKLHQSAQKDNIMVQLLTQLWEQSRQQNSWTTLATEGLLMQITSSLLRLHGCKTFTHRAQLSGWQVQRVTDYAKSDLSQDLSLSKLADLCNLSSQYFCSAFTATVGVSPYQWLRILRINMAKSLLADNNLTILDVALSVGFQNQSSFATTFRKLTGMSPSAYRRFIR